MSMLYTNIPLHCIPQILDILKIFEMSEAIITDLECIDDDINWRVSDNEEVTDVGEDVKEEAYIRGGAKEFLEEDDDDDENEGMYWLDTYCPHLVNIEHGLRCVTDNKDDHNSSENCGHCVIAAVRVTRHQAGVQRVGPGDGAEYQPVEDWEEQHGEEAHHDAVGGDVGHVVPLCPHLSLVPDILVHHLQHREQVDDGGDDAYPARGVGDVGGGHRDRAGSPHLEELGKIVEKREDYDGADIQTTTETLQ